MSVAVAHNFSPQGEAAVLAAAAEARLRDTDLVVLHVVETTGTDPGTVTGQEVERDVRELLASDDAADLAWSVRTVTMGTDTAGALVDLVAEIGADLLVVGNRRRSPVGKLLLGSTVQRILLDATFPVLVVKAP